MADLKIPGTRRLTAKFEAAAAPTWAHRDPDYAGTVPGTVTCTVVDPAPGTTVYTIVSDPAVYTGTDGDSETFYILDLEIGTAGTYTYEWTGDAIGSDGVVATNCGTITAVDC